MARKHEFKYHFVKDMHSTIIPELPDSDKVIVVYDKKYFEYSSCNLDLKVLQPDTLYYAFGLLREHMPSAVGEGKTKNEAVNDLLSMVLGDEIWKKITKN